MREVKAMEVRGGRRVGFSMWLFEQRKRDDRIGEVARDAYQGYQSDEWPETGSLQDYLRHLKESGVRGAPLRALDQAWWEYLEVVTKDVAQHCILMEVGAVMEEALSKAEHREEEDRYLFEGAYVERIQKLMAKLKEI
ncbi:hypothetical protein [Methanocrinis sp.]|uniref:hypothetical protein n=1 Tax=Methanocrinis sp. TaxID=3101522 RepID=UPI003D0DD2DC